MQICGNNFYAQCAITLNVNFKKTNNLIFKWANKPHMVAHICIRSTWKGEAEGLSQVPDQPGQHGEALPEKQKQKQKREQ